MSHATTSTGMGGETRTLCCVCGGKPGHRNVSYGREGEADRVWFCGSCGLEFERRHAAAVREILGEMRVEREMDDGE